MPILYSLISRGKIVLAEYTAKSGNFPKITRILLGKISTNENCKMSYVYDKHIFHYMVDDGIIYLCLADQKSKRRIPFAFLEDIKRKFKSQFGINAQSALAFSMNEDYAPVLKKQMEFYNMDQSPEKIEAIRVQIEATKGTMVENIEKVIERGDKVELLVDKTDRLNQQAFNFDRSSRQLQRTMYWRKVRTYALLGSGISVFILFVTAGACGGLNFSNCRA
mmetsp:Transcript_4812/g.7286  ORF Transcript_4812/g.7286 Transcript_4812/m.7286 type:complete len:221 (+) Transcript_4812:23-685(+)